MKLKIFSDRQYLLDGMQPDPILESFWSELLGNDQSTWRRSCERYIEIAHSFIDTDGVLPFDFAIDWKNYCLWVDEKKLLEMAEKVAEFYNNLSPQEVVDLQHESPRSWKECLSPEGFFANFYRHFQVRTHEKAEKGFESGTPV